MTSPLATIPDDQILFRLRKLIRRGNALEAELLRHLAEVDARRLYLGEGCPSMFAYCVRVLHFAESAAYKRIAAARAARRHPELLEAMRRGDLHVTGVSLLTAQLTPENCSDLISAAQHQTADAIRRMLANRKPKPDVAASVRQASNSSGSSGKMVESPKALVSDARKSEEASRMGPGATVPVASSCPAESRIRTGTEPLGGERYCVRFTADGELYAQIQELQALMRHQIPDGDIGKILAQSVATLLKQVRKRKLGESDKPRSSKPVAERPSRHIPAEVRRAVSKRDEERCTYVSPTGRRCGAGEFLEFHHAEPWARSQAHTVENVFLRCRAHNQYAAVQDFGPRHMARFRASQSTGFKSSSG